MKGEESGKIRALVVDDEPPARRSLVLLLGRDADIELAGECGSGRQALTAIQDHSPDLVFLDVHMPELDGFDVLEKLGNRLPPAIVFVTAYEQYALRAFEAGALDYLLKPYDNGRFERALQRAKEKILLTRRQPQRNDRLVIKSAGQILFVKIPEIDWIEAEDYYARLHVGGKSYLLRRSLTELEQELDPALLCRVHRSAIVNVERIRTLRLNPEGEYNVILENGSELPLSRRFRKHLRSRLGMLT